MIEDEDFVSIKLHDYHKIPQILYWISYRVRGKFFTDDLKSMQITFLVTFDQKL